MRRVIKRVEYKRDGVAVMPMIQEIYVQLGEHIYIYKKYEWDARICTWVDAKKTTWFDGISYHNGVVLSSACTTQELFDCKVEYEGFHEEGEVS